MTLQEIKEELFAGKEIRCKYWEQNQTMGFKNGRAFLCIDGKQNIAPFSGYISLEDALSNEWEVANRVLSWEEAVEYLKTGNRIKSTTNPEKIFVIRNMVLYLESSYTPALNFYIPNKEDTEDTYKVIY